MPEETLVQRIQSGSLPMESLVWTDGMKDWIPASEVAVFATLLPKEGNVLDAPVSNELVSDGVLSPYAPPFAESIVTVAGVETSGPQVRPWIRFWARTFDTLVFGVVLGILLGLLWPEALDIADSIFNIVLLLVISFVAATSFALFGTTPGKAIFRVSVRNADGTKLSFGKALVRELKVLLRGLGLGIPLVSLITQIVCYSRLSGNGDTSWDRDANLTVSHQAIPAWRWFLIVLVIGGFITLISWGASVA